MSGITAKNAPVILPLIAGTLALDDPIFIKAAAIAVGLVFGAMWRAGSLLNDGKGWQPVWKDLLTSGLIGCANAVLVLVLVDQLGVGPLLAMAGGVIAGATGLRALPLVRKAALNRLLGNDVTTVSPSDPSMEEMIRRLDEKP